MFLCVDWPVFSRRPMIEALADVVRDRGITVVAINRPLCPVSTIARKPNRFRELFSSPRLERLSANLFLYSPKYLLHDSQASKIPFIQRLNILVLRQSLLALQHRLHLMEERPIVWYYSPQQGYVSQIFENSLNLYEIYDSLCDIYGQPNRALDQLEVQYRPLVDLLLTTSHVLSDLYAPHYSDSHFFGNGLRRTHFERLSAVEGSGHALLESLAWPRLGYCGALSDRLDWDLIVEIARARPHWQLIFVGPRNGPVPDRKLAGFPNIHLFGAIPLPELPALIKSLSVGILPYRDNQFFQALNPLKFYEFAAAGLPCISSPIPELEQYDRRFVRVCPNDPAAWIEAISGAVAQRASGTFRSIGGKIAADFLWENMIEHLLGHLEAKVVARKT